jgi:hypothetical protein
MTAHLGIAILAAGVFLLPVLLPAPESQGHVTGVLTALDDGAITVTGTDGELVRVSVHSNTVYRQGHTARSRADLAVGNRVVIELTIEGVEQSPDGAHGVAKEIRFARTGETQ